MAPRTQRAFQLRSEAFRLICVSLSIPLVVKEVWKLNRTIDLRPQSCNPCIACSLHDPGSYTVLILEISLIFYF